MNAEENRQSPEQAAVTLLIGSAAYCSKPKWLCNAEAAAQWQGAPACPGQAATSYPTTCVDGRRAANGIKSWRIRSDERDALGPADVARTGCDGVSVAGRYDLGDCAAQAGAGARGAVQAVR